MKHGKMILQSYIELRRYLHITAFNLLKDEMEAEDAVQDVFCNLWEDSQIESNFQARNYLIRTLRNVCLNKIKKRTPVYGDVPETVSPDTTEFEETEKIKNILLNSLTQTQRAIFLLFTEEDWQYEEIAEKFGMTVEAVRKTVSRARAKMREEYKKLTI